MAREIIITVDDNGKLDVREGDRYCDGLCWGEMLEQVAAMTMPVKRINDMNGMIYPMLTKKEWGRRKMKFGGDTK